MRILLPVLITIAACTTRMPATESRATPRCDQNAPTKALCVCSLSELHPTQIAVGMIQVRKKASRLQKLKPFELDNYLAKNPEPAVWGPQGLYIIDHHHLGRALVSIGVETTYCQTRDDLSSMPDHQFWQAMMLRKWVYLFNEKGEGPLHWSKLPEKLTELKDDPYRSLAGSVQDVGGFQKTAIPFAEFEWAQFFRSRIELTLIENDYEKAVQTALALAHSSEAAGLPGYTP